MNSRVAVALLVAGSLTSGGCGRLRDTRNVERRSPAMVLLAGASEVQYFRNHDLSGREESELLSYVISSPFPSTHAICRIVADLQQAGWHPLRRVDDDARTESSYTQGWRVTINRKRSSDEAHVDVWDAAWTNQSGDHLSYSLTFRYPTRGPRNATRMRVGALRTPAHLVKAFRISMGELIPEGETPRISPSESAGCPDVRGPRADGGDLKVKTLTLEQLPADVRGAVEDTARRQAVAADRAVATIRRAYPYEGYSWYQPTAEAKLVAVDVELVGYTTDFDLDDVDLIDGVTGDNYGSDPQVVLLTSDGQVAKDQAEQWSPAPEPLRLLLIYAAPRSLKSVRLGYWGQDLTAEPFPIRGVGPSLPQPDRAPRQ